MLQSSEEIPYQTNCLPLSKISLAKFASLSLHLLMDSSKLRLSNSRMYKSIAIQRDNKETSLVTCTRPRHVKIF
jgi:hypothetical protein